MIVTGRRDGAARFAARVVLATTRADVNGLARRRLDVRKASFAATEVAVAQTGTEYGGITPVGLPAGGGDGLAFELALAALGVLLGLGAGLIFAVYRDRDGVPRSRAGAAYAVGWAVVIGARIGFAYATSHSRGLQVWLGTHHITSAALTDALIFMAAGLLLARTASLLRRARRLPGAPAGRSAGQHEPVGSPAGSRQP